MSCIEWELQRMQAAKPEEHMPLEFILETLHEEEYSQPLVFRDPKVPMFDFHIDVVMFEREPRRVRRKRLPPR